jgi:hypothetical protein
MALVTSHPFPFSHDFPRGHRPPFKDCKNVFRRIRFHTNGLQADGS